MGMRRNWLTGEWEEFESPEGGRQVIARILPEGAIEGSGASVWSRGWSSTAMSVPMEQMEKFNGDARRHGTGAYYVPDPTSPGYAKCVCDTRKARYNEMARRNYFDRNGGYGDRSPHNF
jgi:hypothetical protein